jgi:DNA replication protein DnaC
MDRKVPERERPKLTAAVPFIDEILETDRKAPRKQRHTALRIWMRLRRELPAVEVAESTVRGYLTRKEPVIFLGETGTGKTHLATGPAVAACRQRKRVRFTTAAEMVTELIEAQSQMQLTRARNRWMRYDLIVIDELGYVVMPDAAAELLFQVIAGRAEQAAVIVTTNLPFSEWTTKIPNARLCKAMLDRLTDQAHIIETGDESYRFRRTLARKGGTV